MDREKLSLKIARLGATARLHDLIFFTGEGDAQRARRILEVIERLDPGVYLIGTGPYTQGVYSLTADEIVLGRMATPLEQFLDQAVDIFVNDAAELSPREVSRVHASVFRRQVESASDYFIADRGSTMGTFVDGEPLEKPVSGESQELQRVRCRLNHGAVISLGPSHVNTFVFVDLR